NEILQKYNFPTRSVEEYKTFIGNGIRALVEQSVPPGTDKALQQKMYEEKSKLYEKYWKDGSSLFPGVAELLDELTKRNIPMAIFYNKEDFFTQQIVAGLLGKWTFVGVSGRTEHIPKKPDPTGVQFIMNKLSFLPKEWLYVGDKNADIETA